MLIQEQIKKQVVPFGNGSIVYTPKSWIGQEVIITLPKLSLEEEIFKVLSPYLKNIKGVYLYGSYARNENTLNSDIDLLVISDKELTVAKKGYDIKVLTVEKLKESLKNNPLTSLILKESKAILNESLLKEIKKTKYTKKDFKFLLETTKTALEVNKEIIETESHIFTSSACIFSLILRLRALYMIECILKNKKYTNKEFKNFVEKNKITNFNKLYKIYRKVRDNKTIKIKMPKENVIKLYNLLKNETEKKSKEISNKS